MQEKELKIDEKKTQPAIDVDVKAALKQLVENSYTEAVLFGTQLGFKNAFEMMQMYVKKLPNKTMTEAQLLLFISEFNMLIAKEKENVNK